MSTFTIASTYNMIVCFMKVLVIFIWCHGCCFFCILGQTFRSLTLTKTNMHYILAQREEVTLISFSFPVSNFMEVSCFKSKFPSIKFWRVRKSYKLWKTKFQANLKFQKHVLGTFVIKLGVFFFCRTRILMRVVLY